MPKRLDTDIVAKIMAAKDKMSGKEAAAKLGISKWTIYEYWYPRTTRKKAMRIKCPTCGQDLRNTRTIGIVREKRCSNMHVFTTKEVIQLNEV